MSLITFSLRLVRIWYDGMLLVASFLFFSFFSWFGFLILIFGVGCFLGLYQGSSSSSSFTTTKLFTILRSLNDIDCT